MTHAGSARYLLALCLLAPAAAARAQKVDVSSIGLDQHLDAQLPLDLEFRDESGRAVRLGEVIHERPAVLVFVYHECPMLCTEMLNGLTRALRTISFEPGTDYDVVAVSIDPADTPEKARAKKATYVAAHGRPGAERGWHFLTGEQPAIERLTGVAGFRYVYDPASHQFAHASGVIVVTPQGRLSRYFYGIDPPPRDLRLGLLEASAGTISSPVDQILLLCFHYDPTTGKYGFAIMSALRLGGILTLVAIGAFVVRAILKNRRLAHA